MTTADTKTDRFLIVRLTQQVFRFSVWARLLLDVYRQRRQLARLDQRLLTDIGVSKTQAEQESHRAFWDLPHEQNRACAHKHLQPKSRRSGCYEIRRLRRCG